MRVLQQIPYNSKMVLDLYLPRVCSTRVTPVVLYLHGGAWISSTLIHAREVAINLCAKGYRVVVPQYTLGESNLVPMYLTGTFLISLYPMVFPSCLQPEYVASRRVIICVLFLLCVILVYLSSTPVVPGYPMNVQDVEDALSWVETRLSHCSGPYKPDIFLMGHSAGAHLASVVCHRRKGLKGVIGISGPYSSRLMKRGPLSKWLLEHVFGKNTRAAFPSTHVHSESPPHLLLNAYTDLGLNRHSREYAGVLHRNGVGVTRARIPWTNHFSIRRYWDGKNNRTLEAIDVFIKEHSTSNM